MLGHVRLWLLLTGLALSLAWPAWIAALFGFFAGEQWREGWFAHKTARGFRR